MLAYRARTLAFSMMASSDGVVSLIFNTLRHLAKSAPSFLYCAQRSDSPSRPVRTQTPPSETQLWVLEQRFLNTAYPGWWSLHLFQQGAQRLYPPKTRQTRGSLKQNGLAFLSKNTTWECVHVNTPSIALCIVSSFTCQTTRTQLLSTQLKHVAAEQRWSRTHI